MSRVTALMISQDDLRTKNHDPRASVFFVLAPDMLEMVEQIQGVISEDSTLLLVGEKGTGKTRLARLIHELSPGRNQPLLIVDCPTRLENLLESDLFGHCKEAGPGPDLDRTGELPERGRGTLVLKEIHSLPWQLQGKLGQIMEERSSELGIVNGSRPPPLRIIALSDIPLAEEVRAGRFRTDLNDRLSKVVFHLLPLRDRAAAIPALAKKFLAELSPAAGRHIPGISSEAMDLLGHYRWPGNVRELRHIIEKAVALSTGVDIQVADLPDIIRSAPAQSCSTHRADKNHASPPVSLSKTREEAELARISEALLRHGNNRLRAAAELGITRAALYKKLHKYGLIGAP